jgi:acyl transferase domain-containing protein
VHSASPLGALQGGKSQLRVRHGGFLRGVDRFDAALFRITGAEAELMDPQQRLLLEVTWEVVQHGSLAANNSSSGAAGGGGSGGSLSGPPETGVYVGIQQMEYGCLAAPHLHSIGPFSATGGSFSVAAGRLSFTYGYKGPAVSIDTACSSALVATHQGVLQLRGKPQHGVLTAGVNLMLSEATTAAAQAAGMLTMDGRCKTLDAGADGYVRTEACTAFFLTAGAESAGPAAAAVYLRATYVNQDGRSSSLTAPNGPSQQAVIRGALQAANLQPHSMGALEMHGTGAPGWHA